MKLPPLNAVRAFEATARCGGFTAAATELGVTSAAVSLQVAKAETFLGKKLFLRGNNSLTLTDAGRMLYPQVAQSLSQLSEVTEQFLEQDMRSRLTVSTVQSLAERWVAPAVAQFCKNHPSIGVSLQIDADPFDMRRSPVDLRLSFHAHHDQGLVVRQLLRDSVAPVCAPGFAESVSEVKDAQLIHVDWGASYTSYPTWASWFRHFNIARYPDTSKGIRVAGTGVGIEMAAQGVGLLLAPLHLARSELSNGRLVRLETDQIDLPFGYYATQMSLRTKQGYIDALLQILRER